MSRIRGRHVALAVACIVVGLGLGVGVIALVTTISPYHDGMSQIDASIAAKESAEAARDQEAHAQMDRDEATAVPVCENAVRDQLKSPATAQFTVTGKYVGGPDDNVSGTIEGTVDSQNGFGALVRSDWTCTIPMGSSIGNMQATITRLDQRN